MTQLHLAGAYWRKNSHSDSGAGTCLEAAAVWRKSSHSGSGSGTCVEVAAADRVVAVRDSTDPDGPVLALSPVAWRAFLAEVRAI
ncbi:DUF397 domain-containing protein [Spirillospora sp. NPDC048911]|uniref:DUF397 domain-containing protein n=1 Tax=Spirillospora sp. NPDC048911 TaxID=3364527 RepID=UPI00372412F9